MAFYEVASDELIKNIKNYKKIGENIMVSEPAQVLDNLYREVIFKKKVSKEPSGYLYVDQNNNVVNDKVLCKRLAYVFYYMDIYLNNEKGSVMAALQNDNEENQDKHDFELIVEGLKIIKQKYPANIDEVISIVEKMPALREKNNEKLKILKSKIEEEKLNNKYFNEKMIKDLYPYYKEAMLVNYDKLLLIGKGRLYYGDIKKNAEKVRRRNTLFFNTKNVEKLMKTHYIMGYYNNLLMAYGNIKDMSIGQYTKMLDSAGKRMAESKVSFLRNSN